MTLLWLFWQILISYCKFLMPRPLKWSILGAHTILLSKNIHKVKRTDYVWFEFLWFRRYKPPYPTISRYRLMPYGFRNSLTGTLKHQLFRSEFRSEIFYLWFDNQIKTSICQNTPPCFGMVFDKREEESLGLLKQRLRKDL